MCCFDDDLDPDDPGDDDELISLGKAARRPSIRAFGGEVSECEVQFIPLVPGYKVNCYLNRIDFLLVKVIITGRKNSGEIVNVVWEFGFLLSIGCARIVSHVDTTIFTISFTILCVLW